MVEVWVCAGRQWELRQSRVMVRWPCACILAHAHTPRRRLLVLQARRPVALLL